MHGHTILKLLDILWKNTEISNFMKILAVGTELFHVDGRIDRQADRKDETNARFSQFFKRTFYMHICTSK